MANTNLWEMTGLDIFLQSLDEKEYKAYQKQIEPKPYLSPIQSWGLSKDFFASEVVLDRKIADVKMLAAMAKKLNWKTDLSSILGFQYDALVITDISQKIIWTNPGFFKMTGYSETYAIGKKPSFLQGPETSSETAIAIKQKIATGTHFTEKILNYKKNEEEYWCQLHIFPIQTSEKTTHYLALETEML